MALRASLAALALAAAVTVPSIANAAQTNGSVNLRTGPGRDYARLTTIPGGAYIEVYGCSASWCQVSWNHWNGYIASRDIASDVRYTTPPRYVAPPVYTPAYVAPAAGLSLGWSIGDGIPLF